MVFLFSPQHEHEFILYTGSCLLLNIRSQVICFQRRRHKTFPHISPLCSCWCHRPLSLLIEFLHLLLITQQEKSTPAVLRPGTIRVGGFFSYKVISMFYWGHAAITVFADSLFSSNFNKVTEGINRLNLKDLEDDFTSNIDLHLFLHRVNLNLRTQQLS